MRRLRLLLFVRLQLFLSTCSSDCQTSVSSPHPAHRAAEVGFVNEEGHRAAEGKGEVGFVNEEGHRAAEVGFVAPRLGGELSLCICLAATLLFF